MRKQHGGVRQAVRCITLKSYFHINDAKHSTSVYSHVPLKQSVNYNRNADVEHLKLAGLMFSHIRSREFK